MNAATMAEATDQRRDLGAFLRTRRQAVTPSRAGLVAIAGERRRTPGLRREEVAQLCGISATWYTWLEQGRDIALSAAALARLADALHLTAAERGYLFELARRRDPAPPDRQPAPVVVAAELRAMLETIAAPAYLLDRLWHARAWNGPASDLFAPWLGSGETCLLRFVFLDPAARDFICDWADRARRLLGEFRADIAKRPEDSGVRRLLDDLLRDSVEFRRLWNSRAVLGREGGARRFDHPKRGIVQYAQITLVPSAHPDLKIVALLPIAAPRPEMARNGG